MTMSVNRAAHLVKTNTQLVDNKKGPRICTAHHEPSSRALLKAGYDTGSINKKDQQPLYRSKRSMDSRLRGNDGMNFKII